MNHSFRLVLRGGWTAGLFALAIASQAAIFQGMQNADGWPGCYVGSRADWSSEIGPDYQCSYTDNGSGRSVLAGQGTSTESRPFNTFDAGYQSSWELNRKGGAAGETFSGGMMQVGAAGPNPAYSSFHLYSELAENSPGMGISTESLMTNYFVITADYAYQPIYWAMDWEATLTTTGTVEVAAAVNGISTRNGGTWYPERTLVNEVRTGNITTTFSGSDYGQETWYQFSSGWSGPGMNLYTFLRDNAGAPGTGRLDLRVRLALSDTPITAVPEPASLAVLGVGLPWLLRRRKRA